MANVCNEAALIAARYSAKEVAFTHFEQAIESYRSGQSKGLNVEVLAFTPFEQFCNVCSSIATGSVSLCKWSSWDF